VLVLLVERRDRFRVLGADADPVARLRPLQVPVIRVLPGEELRELGDGDRGLESPEGRSRRAGTLWGVIETIEGTGEATFDPAASNVRSFDEAVAFALRD
jgi:hypothetical protein